MHWWLGAGHPSVDGPAAHADHVLLAMVDGWTLDADLVCTHVDRSGVVAETAVTARVSHDPGTQVAGPPDGARCVRFPGQDDLTGVLLAADIVAASAIDEVVGVGVPVGPDALVDTLGFLRPIVSGGRLVLLVEPAAGGVLRPVEIAQPHECCGGH
jgi:hypothetical protein